MSKTYTEYKLNFFELVDCYGDFITESTIIALNKEQMVKIVKNSYFKDTKDFKIVSEKEIDLFIPEKQVVYQDKVTDLDDSFINPIKILDPLEDNDE